MAEVPRPQRACELLCTLRLLHGEDSTCNRRCLQGIEMRWDTERMEQRITLKTIFEHLQAFRYETHQKFDELHKKMVGLEHHVKWVHGSLGGQIDAIDKRLDLLEITIKEQNHEYRIHRLETHAGLVKA